MYLAAPVCSARLFTISAFGAHQTPAAEATRTESGCSVPVSAADTTFVLQLEAEVADSAGAALIRPSLESNLDVPFPADGGFRQHGQDIGLDLFGDLLNLAGQCAVPLCGQLGAGGAVANATGKVAGVVHDTDLGWGMVYYTPGIGELHVLCVVAFPVCNSCINISNNLWHVIWLNT